MTVDLESLRCFCAAAEQLNFRRAAQTVGVSPQAFSARIAQLESQIGSMLFTRTTRRVSLTEAGERLSSHARSILTMADRCAAVAQAETVVPFELTVGTRFELGLSWLSPALQALAEERPEQQVHLSFGDGPVLQQRLLSGAVDAMLTSSRIENVAVEYEKLHEERYVFVGATKLLTNKPVRTERDFAVHVLLDERADLPLFRYLKDGSSIEGVRFARHQYLGTIGAILGWAVEGGGLAVLPEYLVAPALRSGDLVRVLPKLALASDHFRLVWPVKHRRAEELRGLADRLRRFPLR